MEERDVAVRAKRNYPGLRQDWVTSADYGLTPRQRENPDK